MVNGVRAPLARGGDVYGTVPHWLGGEALKSFLIPHDEFGMWSDALCVGASCAPIAAAAFSFSMSAAAASEHELVDEVVYTRCRCTRVAKHVEGGLTCLRSSSPPPVTSMLERLQTDATTVLSERGCCCCCCQLAVEDHGGR